MKALALDTTTTEEATTTGLRVMPPAAVAKRGSFNAQVYRLHSFRVLDAEGKKVGIVDWIWTDEVSRVGEFLGVRLQWLRGRARAVPCTGASIDYETSTIHVPHTAARIARARRFKIDRSLTAREKRRICFHYALEPATLPSLRRARPAAA